MGFWIADATFFAPDSQLPMTILALVVMCWGIVVACFGVTLCRKVSFGLLFLLFMVPLPSFLLDATIGFLQRSSAEATDVLFSLLGIRVFRQGFVFSLSNFTIHVAEECSGIRSALSLFITSLVAGHFSLRAPWAKTGLVAFGVPLTIVKNAFRIVGLSLLANYVDPTFITDSVWHRSGGIALSDVYAMGGTPILALAIVGMPVGKMPPEVMRRIMEGGADVCRAAGIPLAGGHSIDSPEPIYGLAAIGLVEPGRVKRNDGAQPGDLLVLGKPLGIGVLSAALKKGILDERGYAQMVGVTTQLNRVGRTLAALPGVHAMTDVTGFGLAGHLAEICRGSGVGADIEFGALPVLESARPLLEPQPSPANSAERDCRSSPDPPCSPCSS